MVNFTPWEKEFLSTLKTSDHPCDVAALSGSSVPCQAPGTLTRHPVSHPVSNVCSLCSVVNIRNIDGLQQSHDLSHDVPGFSTASKTQSRWPEGALIRLHNNIKLGDIFLNMQEKKRCGCYFSWHHILDSRCHCEHATTNLFSEAEKCFLWKCVHKHKRRDLSFYMEIAGTVQVMFWGTNIL